MTAIAIRHRDTILERLEKGEFLTSIAESMKVSHAAISQQLSKDAEYIEARKTGAAKRLVEKYRELETADDPLTLARARETWKAAAWFAEREFPEVWGQRPQANQGVSSIADLLMAVSAKMLRDSNKPAKEVIDITPIADK